MQSSRTQSVLERLVVVRSVVFGCSQTWARSHTLRQTTGTRTESKIHAIVFHCKRLLVFLTGNFLTGKKVIADIRPLRSAQGSFLVSLFILGFSRRSSFGDSRSLWYWDWKTIPVARPNFHVGQRNVSFCMNRALNLKTEALAHRMLRGFGVGKIYR